jgi:hypothetical protein
MRVREGVRRRLNLPVVLPALAGLLLLAFAIPNVAPTLRAARAEGVHGTFTASRLTCVQHPGHEQCTWYGTFRAPERDREVTMYGAGRTTLRPGQRVAAVDVAGRPWRVYPPTGSREWLVVSAVLAAAVVLLVPLASRLLRRP